MLKLFTVLINIPPSHLQIWFKRHYTYVAANKQCIRLLQAYFPYFFDKPMGEVVSDRLLRT